MNKRYKITYHLAPHQVKELNENKSVVIIPSPGPGFEIYICEDGQHYEIRPVFNNNSIIKDNGQKEVV